MDNMPSSSRSDSVKTPKLDHDSFIDFEHAAAGHDGVRCTHTGFFIAKPCTPQEVAFYESSALHPAFREFIPTYIGTLSSTDQEQPFALAAAQQGGAIILPGSEYASSSSTTPAIAGTPQSSAAAELINVKTTGRDEPWVPSGGRKLETELSIVLENVACGFTRPNVLDVKLGARLWADDAPPSKRAKLDAVAKETTSGSLGFRIAGMKVWTGTDGETDEDGKTNPYAVTHEGSEGARGEVIEKDGYRRYDKWYGRSFNEKNIREGFETFLAGAKIGTIDRSKLVARRLADGLKRLQEVLESEESRMYSSSVLIIYEGDPDALEQALEEEKRPKETAPEDSEEEDEDFSFALQKDGSFELVDLQVGQDGFPHQTINININPEEMAQLGHLEDEEEEEETPKVHDFRLIDFAHANWTPGQGPDENVLKGVRNLIKLLEELAVE